MRAGRLTVLEEREDGSLIIGPDTSVEAMRRRHGLTPAALEEFEAEYGATLPPDGEG